MHVNEATKDRLKQKTSARKGPIPEEEQQEEARNSAHQERQWRVSSPNHQEDDWKQIEE